MRTVTGLVRGKALSIAQSRSAWDCFKPTLVVPSYRAANMDPSICDNPLDIRFYRESNLHIAFGVDMAFWASVAHNLQS